MTNEVPILEVSDVSVSYGKRKRLVGRSRRTRVVDQASLTIGRGEVLALVGESGSGKSTLARAVMGLLPIDEGQIVLDGVEISNMPERELRVHRRIAQMVFQDPYSSLDPLMTAGEIIEEALRGTDASTTERHAVVDEVMASVGLSGDFANRYPAEFSGGQRQRIAIARALAPEPKLIVCDEPVSALDLSTQNQVIAILGSLRRDRGVSFLFISHDMAVVRQIADRIAVMYSGHIVEEGPTEQVFSSPTHPYTLALLSAIPRVQVDRAKKRKRIILRGDMPEPGNPPPGCRFHPRCPFALEMCSSAVPEERHIPGGGRVVCHLHDHGPELGGASVSELSVREA